MSEPEKLEEEQELEEELESLWFQLYQSQAELEQYQFQLHQAQKELELVYSQRHKAEVELARTKHKMYKNKKEHGQTKERLEKSIEELKDRLNFIENLLSTPTNELKTIHYKKLVREAWYSYEKGDFPKMVQCLRNSLKHTPLSRTKTISDWLQSFTEFSSSQGTEFDISSLVNSEEWKQLIRQLTLLKPKNKIGIMLQKNYSK